MAGDIVRILDELAPLYGRGAYPGRSIEGLSPEWEADPFHVLIATILSQRTKDANTRKASDRLFSEYDSIEELAEADEDAVCELIRPAGFPRQKASGIIGCCRALREAQHNTVRNEDC